MADKKTSPARNTDGLLRGRSPSTKPKKLKPEQELFCVKRAMGWGVHKAARETGMSESTGWSWNRDPNVNARIEELRPLIAEEIREQEVEKFLLDIEHFDKETTRVASMQTPHKLRGFADKVQAIELGYRRMKAIQPKTSVSATATAGAVVVAGATMGAVYKSRWLLEKEEKMRLQLESGNPPTLDHEPPTSA